MNASTEKAGEIYVTGLRHQHAVERQAIELLESQVELLKNYPNLEQRLHAHIEGSKEQARRLEALLSDFGTSESDERDTMMSLAGNIAAMAHSTASDDVLQSSFANYAFKHYEIASYKTLIALAKATGHANAVSALQQSLAEEEVMARFIDEHLEATTVKFMARVSFGGKARAEPDLVTLWEAHCRYEFETRDADATMATMVSQPYVNHIPIMTGGVGHDELRHFYKHHFIGANPPDFRLVPISRTVGENCLVDEFVMHFTHTTEIDWMLPGIAPTGRAVSIPSVAIVQFEDDKLVHEHIYWDQASVLVQIGKLDPRGLPVAGSEQADKAVDRTLPSNVLMGARWQYRRN